MRLKNKRIFIRTRLTLFSLLQSGVVLASWYKTVFGCVNKSSNLQGMAITLAICLAGHNRRYE